MKVLALLHNIAASGHKDFGSGPCGAKGLPFWRGLFSDAFEKSIKLRALKGAKVIRKVSCKETELVELETFVLIIINNNYYYTVLAIVGLVGLD